MNLRIKGLFILSLLLFFVSGCLFTYPEKQPPQPLPSEAPIPKLFPLSTQEKIQAVHHWDLIAGHTADLVKEALETGYPNRVRAIYVSPSGITPFEKVFHALLITKLFEEGLSVSNTPKDNLVLSFDIELVKHPKRVIGIDKEVYASLGPGLIVKSSVPAQEVRSDADRAYRISRTTRLSNQGGDYIFTLPQNEIIITTSLTQNGSYIIRNSSIYYIDDPEWWQYVQKADVTYPPLSNYTLTDR
ncbi:MAG: hypothetical protein JRL30_05805 [Deltaproteobacteria bacterium]|nr:hypothetical protein [Deltaproteobacteria bacterium]